MQNTMVPRRDKVRRYLTTLRWYEDRLCTLSSRVLAFISLALILGLGAVAIRFLQFLDDLTFLMSENDLRTVATLFGGLLVSSAALWVLSCCLGALGHRFMMRRRGL